MWWGYSKSQTMPEKLYISNMIWKTRAFVGIIPKATSTLKIKVPIWIYQACLFLNAYFRLLNKFTQYNIRKKSIWARERKHSVSKFLKGVTKTRCFPRPYFPFAATLRPFKANSSICAATLVHWQTKGLKSDASKWWPVSYFSKGFKEFYLLHFLDGFFEEGLYSFLVSQIEQTLKSSCSVGEG